jgi:hypothetical protein
MSINMKAKLWVYSGHTNNRSSTYIYSVLLTLLYWHKAEYLSLRNTSSSNVDSELGRLWIIELLDFFHRPMWKQRLQDQNDNVSKTGSAFVFRYNLVGGGGGFEG